MNAKTGTAPEGDSHWMALALAEAREAARAGEVPVGAVVVKQGSLIAIGRNSPVAGHDPSAHAEINALRAAAQALGNYRLDGCELFVTLEPCPMCAGAMLHARLARVVFGASDPRTGAAGSVLDLFASPQLNHQTAVQGGVQADDCAALLRGFFAERRAQARAAAQPLRDDALRTPESCFDGIAPPEADLCWTSELPALGGLRMAWYDNAARLPTAQAAQAPVLCLHGPGQWSHLFRHLWPCFAQRRLLAPDLIGHGRSDKPKRADAHGIDWHARVLDQWLAHLGVGPVTLLFHPAMQPLAQALAGQPRQPVRAQLALDARLLARAPAARMAWQAPFADRGHEAVLRAWKLREAPGEDLDAETARRLAQSLPVQGNAMGYCAP